MNCYPICLVVCFVLHVFLLCAHVCVCVRLFYDDPGGRLVNERLVCVCVCVCVCMFLFI